MVSMPYPGDNKNSSAVANFDEDSQNNNKNAKDKKRAYNTARIAELEDEFGDAPVITVEKGANITSKFKQSKVFREQKQRQIDEISEIDSESDDNVEINSDGEIQ